jgi:hypothetical protein
VPGNVSRRSWIPRVIQVLIIRLSWLNIPEERIPGILVLRGTRNLKTQYAKHRAYFQDILDVGSPNGIFEDVLIGTYKTIPVGYASVYGDAMASEITHVFGVLGTSLVIQTGCCGALADGLLPGDLVCEITARCGEGAAHYYLPHTQEVAASHELVDVRTPARGAPVALHTGAVWTTSALLAEGRAELQCWGGRALSLWIWRRPARLPWRTTLGCAACRSYSWV